MPTLTSHHLSSVLIRTLPYSLAKVPGTRGVIARARMAVVWPGVPQFALPSPSVTHRQREGQTCMPLAHHQQDLLCKLILIRRSRACTHYPRSLCYLKGIENN